MTRLQLAALLCLASLLNAGCLTTAPSAASAPESEGYRVVKVIDGDTLDIERDGKTVRIRLLRVDTPEREERGYREASRALYDLTFLERVRLEYEGERRDQHGRELAYIFLGDKNVNLEMVERGLSPFFDRYGEGKYAREFQRAEQAARRARIGIWAQD